MKHASIHEYLDGDLAEPARRETELHLKECERCRAEWDALCALRVEARSLPREIPPPRDLWSGIEARLDQGSVRPRRRASAPERPVWLHWGIRAAAAVVLMVLSSAATLWWIRGGSDAGAPSMAVSTEAPVSQAIPALVAFRSAEAEYIRTADELAATLEARRGVLDPRTVAVVEENLATIDRAIREARAALEDDPNSGVLTEMLSSAYRQKIDLLEQATRLSTQRQI